MMDRRSRWAPLVVLVVLLLLLPGFLLAPRSPASAWGTTTTNPALPHSFSAGRAAASVTPGTPVGPFGGRYLSVQSSPPTGVVSSVSGLAIDPVTKVVYAANTEAGTVTAFGALNGTFLGSTVVANVLTGSFPFAVLLDAANHTLYVSVSTRYAGIGGSSPSGWVLALDQSTLAVRGNITFPGYLFPPFEPSFLAFDGGTAQLFVENATGGEVAAVFVTNDTLRTYIDCGVMMCADHGYGILNIPQRHALIISTCEPQLVVVNTTTDKVVSTITGPAGSIMAWSAYDSRDGYLWVENYTFSHGNGTFLRFNLTNGAITANVPGGEPREASMVYDPVRNILVTSDVNRSQEISVYNASTGARMTAYYGSLGIGHPFQALALDSADGIVVAGGSGNGTTEALRIPSLTVYRQYSAFPKTQPSAVVDARDGVAIALATEPNELVAWNESTGGVVYQTPLASFVRPTGIALDPSTEAVYVVDAASGMVGAFSAKDGTAVGSGFSSGLSSVSLVLAVDGIHQLLYVGGSQLAAVRVFSLPGGASTGVISTPGVSPCALATDPTSGDAFAANCASPGNVTHLRASALDRLQVFPVGSDPFAVAVNSTGAVFVLDSSGTHVTVLHPSGPATGSISLGHRFGSIAVDDVDALLFAAGSANGSLDVVSLASLAVAGAAALPAPSGALSFDPSSGRLAAPELFTGGIDLLSVVPAPGVPLGISALPANNTITLTWNPPGSSGAAPVTSYSVQPWRVTPSQSLAAWHGGSPNATVPGLTDGAPYLFRVSATSSDGTGPWSSAVVAIPVGVPYPPTNLTVASTGVTSASLSWLAPLLDDGAPVTNYSVSVTLPGGGIRSLSVGDRTSAVVGGLSAGTSYTFRVVAWNTAGASSPGTPATAATEPASLTLLWLGVGAVAAAAVAAVGVWAYRRRQSGSPAPDDNSGQPENPD